MLKMEKKILDNNLQYFKGTIEKIVEEIDFKGKPHEMLLIGDLYKQTSSKKPFADYALINRNKTTDFLFELATNGIERRSVSFLAKIIEYRNVSLYDGMKFIGYEKYCKLGYLKEVHVQFNKKVNNIGTGLLL
jgi:hypothetical protein